MADLVRARLGSLPLGDGQAVAVAGALNVSPESFYRGSVAAGDDAVLRAGEAMGRAGAALLDVGAMSTAPYGGGPISPAEEADRLGHAVELLVDKLGALVSADTSRVGPARAALQAGAQVINDVTGLRGDPGLAAVVAGAGAGLIIMASEGPEAGPEPASDPVALVLARLRFSLGQAETAGVALDHVVVDPGIGFFRRQGWPWHEWDCRVLAGLGRLRTLGRPICVGASRKSFIGAVAGEPNPAHRLPGSLGAAAAAVLAGAHLIRAHDVGETLQAVRVAQAIRDAGGG